MNQVLFTGQYWMDEANRGCVEGDGEFVTADGAVVFSIHNGCMHIDPNVPSLFFTNQNCDDTPYDYAELKIRLRNSGTRHVHFTLQGDPNRAGDRPMTVKLGNRTYEIPADNIEHYVFDKRIDPHYNAVYEITITSNSPEMNLEEFSYSPDTKRRTYFKRR